MRTTKAWEERSGIQAPIDIHTYAWTYDLELEGLLVNLHGAEALFLV